MEYVPPPAGAAASGAVVGGRKKVRAPEQIKQEVESEEEKPDRMDIDSEDTDSNTSLQTRTREKRKPQLEKDRKPKGPKYTPVSIYEEKLLLKRLEACSSAVAMTPEARRLKRKLIVRQAKRDRGLPLFDLDQVVNAALLLVDGIYGAKDGGVSRLPAGQATYRTTCQDFRILDRYQVRVPRGSSQVWGEGLRRYGQRGYSCARLKGPSDFGREKETAREQNRKISGLWFLKLFNMNTLYSSQVCLLPLGVQDRALTLSPSP